MTETAVWTYLVVVNDEEQYSIWREGFPLPDGWRATGFTGPEQACLDHIDTVWTDLRPRSLRELQDGTAGTADNGPRG